jgi:hypothetical protein
MLLKDRKTKTQQDRKTERQKDSKTERQKDRCMLLNSNVLTIFSTVYPCVEVPNEQCFVEERLKDRGRQERQRD